MSIQNGLFSDSLTSTDSTPCYFAGSIANGTEVLLVTQVYSGQLKIGMAVCRGTSGCNALYITNGIAGGGIGTYILSDAVAAAVPAANYAGYFDGCAGVCYLTGAALGDGAYIAVPNKNCHRSSQVLINFPSVGFSAAPGDTQYGVGSVTEGSFTVGPCAAADKLQAAMYSYLIINSPLLGIGLNP